MDEWITSYICLFLGGLILTLEPWFSYNQDRVGMIHFTTAKSQLKANSAECERMLLTSFQMYQFDLLLPFSDKEIEQSPLKFSD